MRSISCTSSLVVACHCLVYWPLPPSINWFSPLASLPPNITDTHTHTMHTIPNGHTMLAGHGDGCCCCTGQQQCCRHTSRRQRLSFVPYNFPYIIIKLYFNMSVRVLLVMLLCQEGDHRRQRIRWYSVRLCYTFNPRYVRVCVCVCMNISGRTYNEPNGCHCMPWLAKSNRQQLQQQQQRKRKRIIGFCYLLSEI